MALTGSSSYRASGASSAPVGHTTVLATGSISTAENTDMSCNGSKMGPVSNGKTFTVLLSPLSNDSWRTYPPNHYKCGTGNIVFSPIQSRGGLGVTVGRAGHDSSSPLTPQYANWPDAARILHG